MKKLLLTITCICLLITACDQENDTPPESNRVSILTERALQSIEFQSLNIPASKLSAHQSGFVSAEENSIFIPYAGRDTRIGIVALFDSDDQIRTVGNFEVKTSIPADEIYSSLKDGSFNGKFIFQNEVVDLQIEMIKSKIIGSRTAKRNRVAYACAGITEDGGALDCAGARLENMNWFDAAWCYADFMPCMAKLTISCWIDDCKV